MGGLFHMVPERVEELPAILHSVEAPWWVAGGWAIDLFVGRQTREHEDVEITLFFEDQEAVRAGLRGWDLHVAHAGQLSPWERGDVIDLPRHQLWARRDGNAPWSLEILFETRDGDDWTFRRDPRVRRPLVEFGTTSPDGMPIVVPEIQLLFKAKHPRAKDTADLRAALESMSASATSWLRDALITLDPAHRWLADV